MAEINEGASSPIASQPLLEIRLASSLCSHLLTVRTIVLEDLETGNKFPLEAPRLNFYHAKAMVQLLMMSDEHHEEESEEEDSEG